MAKRPNILKRSAQANKRARAERNKQIQRLVDYGLVSKRQNVKSAITRRNLLSKYKDVLSGKASVITVPKGFAARLKSSMRVVGPKVVVPRIIGEKVKFERSTGNITTTRKIKGERVKRIYYTGGKLPKARKGKKLMFAVSFSGGSRVRYDNFKDLAEFMAGYDPNSPKYVKGNYADWQRFMEIEEVDAGEDEGVDDE